MLVLEALTCHAQQWYCAQCLQ